MTSAPIVVSQCCFPIVIQAPSEQTTMSNFINTLKMRLRRFRLMRYMLRRISINTNDCNIRGAI